MGNDCCLTSLTIQEDGTAVSVLVHFAHPQEVTFQIRPPRLRAAPFPSYCVFLRDHNEAYTSCCPDGCVAGWCDSLAFPRPRSGTAEASKPNRCTCLCCVLFPIQLPMSTADFAAANLLEQFHRSCNVMYNIGREVSMYQSGVCQYPVMLPCDYVLDKRPAK